MGLPNLGEVFASHDVAVAYLFGSRSDATAGPGSDHDIAVLWTLSEPSWDCTERLAADLATVLGTAVDVVDLARAPLELRGAVAERGRVLHSTDDVRRVRFEVDARMRWIEFRPVLREATRCYLRRVAAEGLRRWSTRTVSAGSSRCWSGTDRCWPPPIPTPTGGVTWCRPPPRSRSTWPTTSSPPTGTEPHTTTATPSASWSRSAFSTANWPTAWSRWPGPGT